MGYRNGNAEERHTQWMAKLGESRCVLTGRKSCGMRDGPRNDLWLWDVQSGKQRSTQFGNDEYASELAFSPDGKLLVTASGSVIKVWDPLTGKLRRSIATGNRDINSIVVSPDGDTLATAGTNALRLRHR